MSRQAINSSVQDLIISRDPEVLSGTPVFASTRVPVKTLFDYLAAGDSFERFLEHFPGVEREQVIKLLEQIGEELNEHGGE